MSISKSTINQEELMRKPNNKRSPQSSRSLKHTEDHSVSLPLFSSCHSFPPMLPFLSMSEVSTSLSEANTLFMLMTLSPFKILYLQLFNFSPFSIFSLKDCYYLCTNMHKSPQYLKTKPNKTTKFAFNLHF